MPTNDFVPFGTGAGANVLSQTNYLASGYATGFVAGSVAASAQVGKALRQGTFVAAGLGQFIAGALGVNVVDDGNLTGWVANFTAAIQASIPASGVLSFNGRSGAVTLTSGDVLTALGGTPIFVGGTAVGDLTGTWPGPTIKSGAVTNAKMAAMAALTIKGNNTGVSAAPQDINIADLLTALGFDFSGIGASGIIRCPNGFKIMWGTGFVADDNVGTITLPAAFSTAIWGFNVSLIYTGAAKSGGNGGGATYNVIDLQHVRVMMAWNGDSTGIGNFTWWAYGT